MGNDILTSYLIWHFFDVPKEILKGWKNFLWFSSNYFSIPLLLKTFFSHWRRLAEPYGKGFSPSRYITVFVGNIMSRVIGAILRSFFIIAGLLLEIFVFLGGLVIFLGWFILPILLIAGLVFGFSLIV